MDRTGRVPSHDLEDAKRLVRSGHVNFTGRGRRFVVEHYGCADLGEVAVGVFDAMEPRHFRKSDELVHKPGTFADIYSGMVYDDIEWYVKFFVDEPGEATVNVWSMNWDGCVH